MNAQFVEQPKAGIVELMVPGEAVAATSWWPIAFPILIGIIIAAVVTVVAIRKLNQRDPLRQAYRKVARRLRLTSDEKREVERVATSVGVAPVALLLAPRAMGAKAGYSAVLKGLSMRLAGDDPRE